MSRSIELLEVKNCNCKPVLVCEDDTFNYEAFQYLLGCHNLESDWAEDGQEGVEMFKKSFKCCPYKVVFMDLGLPKMNGYEANKAIQEF